MDSRAGSWCCSQARSSITQLLALVQPSKAALDDPAFGQSLEPIRRAVLGKLRRHLSIGAIAEIAVVSGTVRGTADSFVNTSK